MSARLKAKDNGDFVLAKQGPTFEFHQYRNSFNYLTDNDRKILWFLM